MRYSMVSMARKLSTITSLEEGQVRVKALDERCKEIEGEIRDLEEDLKDTEWERDETRDLVKLAERIGLEEALQGYELLAAVYHPNQQRFDFIGGKVGAAA